MVKRVALFLLVIGFSYSGANAQKSGAEFSLHRVVARVLQKNPEVQAAEKSFLAARARLLTQRPLLADPVFVAEYEGLSRLRPNLRGYEERVLGIGQQIELPFKWWTRNDIASKEAQVAEMDFELAKLQKVAEAKKAYGEVLTAERERELAIDNLSLAQDFLKKAKVRYEAGDVPRIEVLRAEIEVAKAERDTLVAGKSLLLAKASLNLLMARDAHAPLILTDRLVFAPVDYDMDSLKAVMMERHPQARALNYAVAGSRSAVRLSALNFLPDLELAVSRQTVTGVGNFWVAEIGFDVPLWFLFRQRGDLQEAKANLAQAQAERISIQNELILGLENAYHQLHVAEKQVRIYTEKLLEEAEEVYRIASRSYEEGEASYLEVLEAQRTLRTTRTEYVQALLEYHSALADLELAVGGELTAAVE
jgi:cobalt-zinc-cadmium efflux system outer membrane protein